VWGRASVTPNLQHQCVEIVRVDPPPHIYVASIEPIFFYNDTSEPDVKMHEATPFVVSGANRAKWLLLLKMLENAANDFVKSGHRF
jgi:hypothetical protein